MVPHAFLTSGENVAMRQFPMDSHAVVLPIPLISLDPVVPSYVVSGNLQVPFMICGSSTLEEVVAQFLQAMLKYRVRIRGNVTLMTLECCA